MEIGRGSRRTPLLRARAAAEVMRNQEPRILLYRLLALALVGIVLTIVAPVIADENATPPPMEEVAGQPSQSASPIPSESASDAPADLIIPIDPSAPSPSPAPSANSASPGDPNSMVDSPDSMTVGGSATASPESIQTLQLNIPTVLPVDPRALFSYLPPINVSGSRYLLACLRGNNLLFDVYAKNSRDSFFNEVQLVEGDLTSDLLISGTTDQVVAILNSGGGTRIVGARGPLGGLYLSLTLIALTSPSLDPVHCGQASAMNSRTIYLRALGLGMDLIKNGISLNR